MTTRQLVAWYEEGRITSGELFVRALALVDPADPGATLDTIPCRLYGELRSLLEVWRPGAIRSNHGPVTTPAASIDAASRWLLTAETRGKGRAL